VLRTGVRMLLGTAVIALALGGPLQSVARAVNVDQAASQALTAYLKQHRLPLVGAQVIKENSGGRTVLLYGYVATDQGKADAERKAIAYLGNPAPTIDDRLVVKPELATMTAPQSAYQAQPQEAEPQVEPEYQAGQSGTPAISFDGLYQQIQQYGIKSPPGE